MRNSKLYYWLPPRIDYKLMAGSVSDNDSVSRIKSYKYCDRLLLSR